MGRSSALRQARGRARPPIPAGLKPGTVLVREWEGTSRRVMVLADGFAWNGGTYPSLSKVARAITGTRWNGPRFFGLRDRARENDQARRKDVPLCGLHPGLRPSMVSSRLQLARCAAGDHVGLRDARVRHPAYGRLARC